MPFQNTITSRIASIVAALIAMIALLTYAENRCEAVDVRLSARIAAVELVQERNHMAVMQTLMDQGSCIGEIKGMLGRIESRIGIYGKKNGNSSTQ